MNKINIFILLGAALIFGSCCATQKTVSIDSLAGEWLIETIDAETIGQSEQAPFIGFDLNDKRIFGNSGCNNMMGSIKQEKHKAQSLILGPIATTMMMCPQMDNERRVLDALNRVTSFALSADQALTLNDKDGNTVATLRKR